MDDYLEEDFIEILSADEFVKEFDTMECFRDWCLQGSLLDLEEVKETFIAYELYEHCAIIQSVIDLKINDIANEE